jgi:hypothetical protein
VIEFYGDRAHERFDIAFKRFINKILLLLLFLATHATFAYVYRVHWGCTTNDGLLLIVVTKDVCSRQTPGREVNPELGWLFARHNWLQSNRN